jgi:pantetheine hydrolase
MILPVSLLLALGAASLAAGQSSSYKGAVAQHATYFGKGTESIAELVSVNMDMYERHTQLAAANGAQIIAFPEFGLVPVSDGNRTQIGEMAENIPLANSLSIPCGNEQFVDRPILTRSSCMAISSKIVVMVNVVDSMPCPNSDPMCPDDARYLITTDVIFDETGMVVAKYHKSHEWPGLMPPYNEAAEPLQVTYKTSFGVEFGLFICFDIMFQKPAVSLVDAGVKHFLYAVKQGLIGEDTLISGWSKKYQTTMLSSNLAAVVHDCSGVIVNGETLPAVKIMLGDEYPEENVIISVIPV